MISWEKESKSCIEQNNEKGSKSRTFPEPQKHRTPSKKHNLQLKEEGKMAAFFREKG